jgi:LuxR family maltose regulon positive regulatory protein
MPSSTKVVRSKLYAPRIPRNALERRRLLDLLSQDRSMALISAPAGYGKSTLLSQWTAECTNPVAWVTLDRDDSDPIRFLHHLVGALDQAIPGRFEYSLDANAPAATEDVVSAILNSMCASESCVTLVIDDYHEGCSQEVDQMLARLISALPVDVKLVLATRHDPDLALSRLRAAEQLIDIRQKDLRFTEEEAADWFASRSITTTPEGVSESLAITEGWPAAYTMIFGAERHRRSNLDSTDRRHVAEYIREEVVQHHSDVWPLLVVAAFCPRVCGPLVESTLDIADGGEALRQLERSDLVFERLNGDGDWYRLHQLVADHVLLAHTPDPDIQRWMLRAAEWFTSNGESRTALDILIRAGEHAAACDMINMAWLDHFRDRQFVTLRNDLARIAPEVAERNASFLVTRAWLHAHDGRQRDAMSDLRRAGSFSAGPLPDGCPSVEAAQAAIETIYAVRGLPTARESASRLDTLIDDPSAWRPLADFGFGCASFMTGDLETAQSAFDRVLASSDSLLRSAAIGWSTVIDVMQGRVESARDRYDEAASLLLEHPRLVEEPAVAVAGAALAWAEGRPIDAAADLEAFSAELGSADLPTRLETLIWLAAAETSIGRTKRARRCLDAAERLIERLGGSDWHNRRLQAIEDRMGPATENNGRDPGLTDREERILQLLSATHLSQREMARELGISFNTIKSHVKSIYVKLGATSRDEASQIARSSGLL